MVCLFCTGGENIKDKSSSTRPSISVSVRDVAVKILVGEDVRCTIEECITHLRQVVSSTTTLRTGLFSKAGCLVSLYYYYVLHITKTYLYDFDPVKPHFYIVKLGLTGVYMYIIFLISGPKHRLSVLVGTASLRRFLRVPIIYVLRGNMKKYQFFYLKIFIFWRRDILYI